jgi:oligopeptide/dipeptide ABC transporter ATP-binding protein
MITISHLHKTFTTKHGPLIALNDISLTIPQGATVGLVGESGSGKSTLGKCLLRLHEPTRGSILFNTTELTTLAPKPLKAWRKSAQMIFQDPYASLNPRMTVDDLLKEPLKIHGIVSDHRIADVLDLVQLSSSLRSRFPHELSGGQRQRVALARGMILSPSFLICDEPIASLDVSVQAQIALLLKNLQKQLSLTILFISHDLRMVKYLAETVAVMYLGEIVELAPTGALYTRPLHPYTEALIASMPIPDPVLERKRTRIVLQGDPPSPIRRPPGCPFAPRCLKANPICHTTPPKLRLLPEGRSVACHLV